jgi:hypothetical protein
MFTAVLEERPPYMFSVDDGGKTFLQNVGNHLPDYPASQTRRQNSSIKNMTMEQNFEIIRVYNKFSANYVHE